MKLLVIEIVVTVPGLLLHAQSGACQLCLPTKNVEADFIRLYAEAAILRSALLLLYAVV